MTLKYLAILAMLLPMVMLTPAFALHYHEIQQQQDPVVDDLVPGELLPTEPELNLVDPIDVSLFVDVIVLLQHLLDLFNQVIDMVNTNTIEIAEMKQQIAELQSP